MKKTRNYIAKIFYVFIFLFTNTTIVFTAENNVPDRYHFIGRTGNTLQLQMDLEINNYYLTGKYYYEFTDIPLTMTGTIFSGGRAKITIYDNNDINTGFILGEFNDSKESFNGNWYSADYKKILPFSLKRVAKYNFIRSQSDEVNSTIVFPSIDSSLESVEKINKQLERDITQEHMSFLSEAEMNYIHDSFFHNWEQIYDLSIAYYSDSLISFIAEKYAYTGGAHGNTAYKSINIAINKSDLIQFSLDDLFISGISYINILSNYIVSDLKKQEAGWIINGTIKEIKKDDLKVFTISKYGIKFYFAPYHMGCYAEGTYYVTVPYRVLKDCIDYNGPLTRILNHNR